MPLAQERFDLALRLGNELRADCRDHDGPYGAQHSGAHHLALGRGERNEHGIVLIASLSRLPLWRQDTDNAKGHIMNTHHLIQWVLAGAKKIIDDGLAQY